MPASTLARTRSSASGWPTSPICLYTPCPLPNVIVPRQSWETSRPVLPRGLYFTFSLHGVSDPRIFAVHLRAYRHRGATGRDHANEAFSDNERRGQGVSGRDRRHDRTI